jgi:8-oxo-dGTP diphosphatase
VAAGIIWRAGRFLAARRPEGTARAGYWEFPGGKQEPGESITQALLRELREELGIECESVAPWKNIRHEYQELRVEIYFMHVTAFHGEPVPMVGQELRWVSPEEALALDFLPADKAVLSEIAPPDHPDG